MADPRADPAEELPLRGRVIAVTRAPEQGGELAERLRALGAELLWYPLLRIVDPADSGPLAAACDALADYDWVGFTSRNGVERLCARLRARGREPRDETWPGLAAVGPGTADALHEQGLPVHLLPERLDAEGLATALIARGPAAARALLPQADNARPLLRARLRAAGWRVDAVTAYRGLPAQPQQSLAGRRVDAVTLASSAAVERFLVAAGRETLARLRADGCRFVAIGERTAATLAEHALPASVADEPTLAGLVDAVAEACRPSP